MCNFMHLKIEREMTQAFPSNAIKLLDLILKSLFFCKISDTDITKNILYFPFSYVYCGYRTFMSRVPFVNVLYMHLLSSCYFPRKNHEPKNGNKGNKEI